MKREVELAKRLLESKGYKVSKRIKEDHTYSGHDVSRDLQQYLVTIVLGGTDGDGETGMVTPDFYTELVSAINEDDARHQVEKGLNPGDGVGDVHLATPEEVAEWEQNAYDDMNESSDKFKVGDVISGNESGNFYKIKEITTTHYVCDDLQGHGTTRLFKNKVDKTFSLEESNESDIPHTEQYKGYSIQSYNNFGATVYKDGKKIREFENIDDAREYIDGLSKSRNPLEEALIKSIRKLHESAKFSVGDIVSYSMLYGGTVRAKVVSRTEDSITVKENWSNEDTGEVESNEETYPVSLDSSGSERAEVWEYHGEHGYVYPPSNEFDS